MKRAFDISVAALAICLLSIPIILTAIAVRMTSSGPVIFYSNRIGKDKQVFAMPKFRTMRVGTPNVATHLLADGSQYLTPIGAILRRTSLDELPQLFSVLKGDMSIVGPRPALFNQDDLIALRDQYHINELRPGVTGWAQVNGRDTLSIEEKVILDKVYYDQKSFWFDLRIVFLTALKVIKKQDIKH